jgi:hypothetical protein
MLPWIEKYRPNHIDDIILEDETKNMLLEMVNTKNFPNILLNKQNNCNMNYNHISTETPKSIFSSNSTCFTGIDGSAI